MSTIDGFQFTINGLPMSFSIGSPPGPVSRCRKRRLSIRYARSRNSRLSCHTRKGSSNVNVVQNVDQNASSIIFPAHLSNAPFTGNLPDSTLEAILSQSQRPASPPPAVAIAVAEPTMLSQPIFRYQTPALPSYSTGVSPSNSTGWLSTASLPPPSPSLRGTRVFQPRPRPVPLFNLSSESGFSISSQALDLLSSLASTSTIRSVALLDTPLQPSSSLHMSCGALVDGMLEARGLLPSISSSSQAAQIWLCTASDNVLQGQGQSPLLVLLAPRAFQDADIGHKVLSLILALSSMLILVSEYEPLNDKLFESMGNLALAPQSFSPSPSSSYASSFPDLLWVMRPPPDGPAPASTSLRPTDYLMEHLSVHAGLTPLGSRVRRCIRHNFSPLEACFLPAASAAPETYQDGISRVVHHILRVAPLLKANVTHELRPHEFIFLIRECLTCLNIGTPINPSRVQALSAGLSRGHLSSPPSPVLPPLPLPSSHAANHLEIPLEESPISETSSHSHNGDRSSNSSATASLPDSSTTSDKDLCVVCLSTSRNTALIPCKHFAYCEKCATTLKQMRKGCAICRQPIREVFSMFVA
mmetsp:Transcript_8750/g.14363  ORF Transcript_8750/g.14363 Transcript_8750/m.14363 type:complete len:585 (-) Transcript_8750:604-2358(-)|eukprot:CAMPEP_0184333492 /NCGR_PEP_ID=MMETSP1089-20130417/2474_1 /TAXON_ID=38269 ORGANISM="Gloeochaete wittrockiana, Strain SAG46.84" /NCGR_SAMPLE_ID=MMETSP1089 /ASSEMBLY_ACC=CAM_ASM_000445 /LENGTH=584 /DNA_ID=CAMNT_0026657337 /DNA_START=160 /DNA_END=1914 /DNA_ORIENTATION=+